MASFHLHGANANKVNGLQFIGVVQEGGINTNLVKVGGLQLEEDLEGVVFHDAVDSLMDAIHAEGFGPEGNDVGYGEERSFLGDICCRGCRLDLGDQFGVCHWVNNLLLEK